MARLRDTYTGKYVDVAASQTGAVIKTSDAAAGAVGDWLEGITVVPETTSAGTIALIDGSTSVNVFIAGTLSNLQPFTIWIKARAKNALGWSITTGAAVHVRAFGNF